MTDKKTILVFAPHPDDEVLGCGGMIAKRTKEGSKVIVCIVTNTSKEREEEARKADLMLGVEHIEMLRLPELQLDRLDHTVLNDAVLDVIERFKPNEVFIPYSGDLHTDHRALAEAVIVATRPKYSCSPTCVYEYETMSETGWNYIDEKNAFNPNVYECITDELSQKLDAISCHESQVDVYPACRSIGSIQGLAFYRGAQSEMKYAEAFRMVREYRR